MVVRLDVVGMQEEKNLKWDGIDIVEICIQSTRIDMSTHSSTCCLAYVHVYLITQGEEGFRGTTPPATKNDGRDIASQAFRLQILQILGAELFTFWLRGLFATTRQPYPHDSFTQNPANMSRRTQVPQKTRGK